MLRRDEVKLAIESFEPPDEAVCKDTLCWRPRRAQSIPDGSPPLWQINEALRLVLPLAPTKLPDAMPLDVWGATSHVDSTSPEAVRSLWKRELSFFGARAAELGPEEEGGLCPSNFSEGRLPRK